MTEAQMKLALIRSQQLHEFYAAERRAGADPLLANYRMHEFAKRLDSECPYETELKAVREIMESVK